MYSENYFCEVTIITNLYYFQFERDFHEKSKTQLIYENGSTAQLLYDDISLIWTNVSVKKRRLFTNIEYNLPHVIHCHRYSVYLLLNLRNKWKKYRITSNMYKRKLKNKCQSLMKKSFIVDEIVLVVHLGYLNILWDLDAYITIYFRFK